MSWEVVCGGPKIHTPKAKAKSITNNPIISQENNYFYAISLITIIHNN